MTAGGVTIEIKTIVPEETDPSAEIKFETKGDENINAEEIYNSVEIKQEVKTDKNTKPEPQIE